MPMPAPWERPVDLALLGEDAWESPALQALRGQVESAMRPLFAQNAERVEAAIDQLLQPAQNVTHDLAVMVTGDEAAYDTYRRDVREALDAALRDPLAADEAQRIRALQRAVLEPAHVLLDMAMEEVRGEVSRDVEKQMGEVEEAWRLPAQVVGREGELESWVGDVEQAVNATLRLQPADEELEAVYNLTDTLARPLDLLGLNEMQLFQDLRQRVEEARDRQRSFVERLRTATVDDIPGIAAEYGQEMRERMSRDMSEMRDAARSRLDEIREQLQGEGQIVLPGGAQAVPSETAGAQPLPSAEVLGGALEEAFDGGAAEVEGGGALDDAKRASGDGGRRRRFGRRPTKEQIFSRAEKLLGEELPEELKTAIEASLGFLTKRGKWLRFTVNRLREEGYEGKDLVEKLLSEVRVHRMRLQTQKWAEQGCTREEIQQRLTDYWLDPKAFEFTPCAGTN
eukprot:CAMPEP_0119125094 /NCGR_PEP_ID=MMETSP1310-20130426/4485_1 /TAXON_ID=464262 /ORGANISM="Genus nov. species nov., Strain RCC2339" /LENGTH=454 /DNA_ID=CAMNT_0007115125 /DNA_START=1 /DNA_END=1365 /DNA_ORIENTATION=+